jgi:hypothetical protein
VKVEGCDDPHECRFCTRLFARRLEPFFLRREPEASVRCQEWQRSRIFLRRGQRGGKLESVRGLKRMYAKEPKSPAAFI